MLGTKLTNHLNPPTHYSTVGVSNLSAQIRTYIFFAVSVPTGLCLRWDSTGQVHTTYLDKLVERIPHEPD